MALTDVPYLDRFVTEGPPTVNEEALKSLISARLRELRAKKGLTQKQLASALECSHTSVCFWESRRVLMGIGYGKKLHTLFGVDLNWLLRVNRSLADIHEREFDTGRLARIFRRIDDLPGSIRILMVPELRALIARAIYTASEHHEEAFFSLIQTSGKYGFTGHKWVMSLDEARREELTISQNPTLSLSNRIKLVRCRLGLTNNGFSQALGVPQTTWLTWESGREPHLHAFVQAFEAFDVDFNWLIGSDTPQYAPLALGHSWEEFLP